MDSTELLWLRCQKHDKVAATSKSGDTPLGFQVVCDHLRFIHYVSSFFLGGTNDITKKRNDPYPLAIMEGLYQEVEYVLYDKNGIPHVCQGAYIIVDGGYLNVACFMNPLKGVFGSKNDILWSEMIESVRKDVECVFGILKQRFRMLRNGILLEDEKYVEYAFKTCCILHNMILLYDGLDERWEELVNWETLDPDGA